MIALISIILLFICSTFMELMYIEIVTRCFNKLTLPKARSYRSLAVLIAFAILESWLFSVVALKSKVMLILVYWRVDSLEFHFVIVIYNIGYSFFQGVLEIFLW